MESWQKMEETNLYIGKSIRKLRESWNLSQRELAEVLHLNHPQSISEIEKGDRALKAYELTILSSFFHIDIAELLCQKKQEKPVVQWRKENLPANLKDESKFIKRCYNYEFIARCTGANHSSTLPQLSHYDPQKTAYEDVHEWAHRFRKALALGDKPAYSIREAIEDNWGVWVFSEELSAASAACTKGEFGAGILLNSSEPRWRQNYSLGHELFHLITWGPGVQPDMWAGAVKKRNETLANIFSSALLMPEELIRKDFNKLVTEGKVQWYDILMLARSYDVSTLALVWRLASLGLIPENAPQDFKNSEELTKLDRDIDRDRKTVCSCLPKRYVRLAYKAYNDSEISIGRLADLLEISVSELGDELQKYDIELYSDAYKATISTS
jgi:Zn-dependent peptidase ImmA (M78 family)/transcriptional regulator with XRE-family HTH domain